MTFFIILIIIIYFIAFFIKLKMPAWIDRSGEYFVSRELRKLDAKHYVVLDDLMLPSNGNSKFTQIDHIVVSNFGIFCIETKTYKGWIFGSADRKYWTQVIYKFRNKFYNPLHQNFVHIKAIENLLGHQRLKSPIISLVVFTVADKMKFSGTDSVGYIENIMKNIESHTVILYNDFERDEMVTILSNSNILDEDIRRLHNEEVKELKR